MPAQRILVVDDEPTILSAVAEMLTAEGYEVIRASTGAEALERFRTMPPHIVLLDIMLPGISGLELCRTMRRESNVPIILLTARDAEADKVLGLEVGADDYVAKPFSLRELSARVRAQLRRAAEAAPRTARSGEMVRIGGAEVDLSGHRLLKDGAVVAIKPRAFQLLAYLLAHRGQVFTREQLLEHVWGTDYPGETRTVDVHVHAIREQIEPDPGMPTLLQTVRGVGYVLRRPSAQE